MVINNQASFMRYGGTSIHSIPKLKTEFKLTLCHSFESRKIG